MEAATPVKINWNGDARSKFKSRKVRARVDKLVETYATDTANSPDSNNGVNK